MERPGCVSDSPCYLRLDALSPAPKTALYSAELSPDEVFLCGRSAAGRLGRCGSGVVLGYSEASLSSNEAGHRPEQFSGFSDMC